MEAHADQYIKTQHKDGGYPPEVLGSNHLRGRLTELMLEGIALFYDCLDAWYNEGDHIG
jgi:hypothetical protein